MRTRCLNAPSEQGRRDGLLRRFAGRCAYCGVELPGRFIVEHVEPVSRGGALEPANLAAACGSCNSSKADLFLVEWVFKRAGLLTCDPTTRALRVVDPPWAWQRSPGFLALPTELLTEEGEPLDPFEDAPPARRESRYAACIRVAPAYRAEYDVRHIEAYIRLQYSTLDGLAIWQMNDEVALAVQCIDVGGVEGAENLALSYGL